MRNIILVMAICWLAVIGVSLCWNLEDDSRERERLGEIRGKINLHKLLPAALSIKTIWTSHILVFFLGSAGLAAAGILLTKKQNTVVRQRDELQQEITVRKMAEQDLRVFKKIVSASCDHMSFLDRSYTYQAVNDAYLNAHGRTRDEIVGHTVPDILGQDIFKGLVAEKLDRCLAGEEIAYLDWFDFPGQGKRYMAVDYRPFINDDGIVEGVVVNSKDITELKIANDEICRAEREWAHTFDSIADFVSVHDSEHRLVRVNKSLADFLKKSPEELIGRPCYEVLHGMDEPWVECPHMKMLTNNKSFTAEVFDPHLGVPLLLTVSPIFDESGRMSGSVHIARDVSELKKAQEEKESLHDQLIQAQKMECIGTIAGGVAHDFNNVLSVILGSSEFAKLECRENENLQELLTNIITATQMGAALTRQLLIFIGNRDVKIQTVWLNNLVEGMSKLLKRVLGAHVETAISLKEENVCIQANAGHIEQVLVNLAVNARDAMPRGGKLSIATDFAAPPELLLKANPAAQAKRYAVLVVSDTGTGMRPEIKNRIFEPFFTTKEAGKGTGIGLATVYGIVRQHNGIIQVESEPGRGSTFKVFFPAADSPCKQKKTKVNTVLPGSGETILLAEDDPALRSMMAASLDDLGYEVLSAADGKTAMKAAEEHSGKCDLLLTDLIMPNMSGDQLFKRLQKRYPGLKVLYMSGHSEDILASYNIDADFIKKPVSLYDLSGRICEALEKSGV